MRIVVHGNSVALRVRPPRARLEERTYAEWLRAAGHEVRTVARAGALLGEMFATFEDDAVAPGPDVLILNHGIVEVCPRRTVRWLNNRTIDNYYLNATLGRPHIVREGPAALAGYGWRVANAVVRIVAGAVGLQWQWQPLRQFVRVMEDTITVALKESRARVFVLCLNPPSDRIERALPGTGSAVATANEELAALARRMGDRVRFVTFGELVGDLDPERAVPDGVHFSADAHERVARTLLTLLDATPVVPG